MTDGKVVLETVDRMIYNLTIQWHEAESEWDAKLSHFAVAVAKEIREEIKKALEGETKND